MKETASDTLIQGFEAGRLRASIQKRQITRNTPEPTCGTILLMILRMYVARVKCE